MTQRVLEIVGFDDEDRLAGIAGVAGRIADRDEVLQAVDELEPRPPE